MTTAIVTEGQTDLKVLRRLLANEIDLSAVGQYAAGGYSAVDSLGRTLLIRGVRRLALVLDADSTKPEAIRERKKFLEFSLRQISDSASILIELAVPEFEAIFFGDRGVLTKLVGRQISDEDWIVARYEPRRILKQYLAGQDLEARLNSLDPKDIEKLQSQPQIAEVAKFLAGTNPRRKPMAVAESQAPYGSER